MPCGATPTSATGPDAMPPRRQKGAMGGRLIREHGTVVPTAKPGVFLRPSRPSPRSDIPGAGCPDAARLVGPRAVASNRAPGASPGQGGLVCSEARRVVHPAPDENARADEIVSRQQVTGPHGRRSGIRSRKADALVLGQLGAAPTLSRYPRPGWSKVSPEANHRPPGHGDRGPRQAVTGRAGERSKASSGPPASLVAPGGENSRQAFRSILRTRCETTSA
jgi:hypothetical protein